MGKILRYSENANQSDVTVVGTAKAKKALIQI
jgi:hypothetical protein